MPTIDLTIKRRETNFEPSVSLIFPQIFIELLPEPYLMGSNSWEPDGQELSAVIELAWKHTKDLISDGDKCCG